MSTHENSNYPLPPMGQMNLVNGTPSQQAQSPSTLQQQQLVQQKQQQLQQQQQTSMRVPLSIDSDISKYLPSTSTHQSPQTINGPPTTQSYASSLPPHIRALGMNGPPGPVGSPLVNGARGDASADSSRTASPTLQTSPQYQQQSPGSVQQQSPSQPLAQNRPPPTNTSAAATASVLKFSPQPTTGNMQNLAGSMQNLNLNRANGPVPMQQPQAMPPTSNAAGPPLFQQIPPNIHGNFKTSALNAATSPMQPTIPPSSAASNMPSSNINRPAQTAPAINSAYQPGMSLFRQTAPPPPSSTNNTENMYAGTSAASLIMRPLPGPQIPINRQNANNPPPQLTSSMPPLPTSTNAMQQNQLNNNQQQQQLPLQPPPTALRKPMYPTTAQMPPSMLPSSTTQQPQQQQMPPSMLPSLTPQQLQQQQTYSQPYQQQPAPPPPTGMFNGQSNTGPLQYQSQPQMPQQQQQLQQQYPAPAAPTQYNQQMSVTQQGFNRLWGHDTIDLMQNRHILTPATLPPPKIVLHNQFHESINCNPDIMRCTIAKIPESNSLLQKSRLPLGILIHPFRDINSLPVIQCPNIVRCRLCRTYINPFVYFVDSKMWKCNLCYRVNELPEDFQFDPATKTYGDVTRRPEVRSSTIEFIAPSEYMLRPPQPAIYLFLFDVSIIAQQSGYLENACAVLSDHLEDMPGDARAQVGFIAYNSQVHFYSMADGFNRPHEMTLLDIDDPFLPRPDSLLVNLKECKELIKDLLTQLPQRFADSHDPGSVMGAALQVAFKLMQHSGGRVTVFQTCLPNKGPGSLEAREDPNNRSAKDVAHLNPATDFYKRYALECSGYQIAVDLFLLNQQYSDLATISGMSKHSGGCVHHFPLYQKTKPQHVDSFKQCFKRYLVRKIGFEAVMRIRCTRGLQVHTFHGNFFVRSTDLLSLPNVNPDAGYGMQISYEETLNDVKTICFQAALLYTNSEGERRIRVHTLCLPVTSSLAEVMHAADAAAIIGLLSKMAVDRSLTSNVADAREAFINATVDILNAFKIAQNLPAGQSGQLIAPRSLALMPLYILALLKHPAFRVGTSTRLDDRVHAMDCMKTLPLDQLMKFIYPEFYKIDALFYNAQNSNVLTAEDDEEDEEELPEVPRLQLSAEHLDSRSIFLMDCGNLIMIYVGLNVPVKILENALGIKSTAELPDYYYGLPNVNSTENDILRRFILRLNDDKPYAPVVQIIRDTSTAKPQFMEKLVDDRSESSLSYYEFLQHIRTQVK